MSGQLLCCRHDLDRRGGGVGILFPRWVSAAPYCHRYRLWVSLTSVSLPFQGARIQGDSHRNFVGVLEKRVTVGRVYKVSGSPLRPPRPRYHTCLSGHWISLTATTKFDLQDTLDLPFKPEAFEFVLFPKLPSRVHPSPFGRFRRQTHQGWRAKSR